jgi:ABC-type sugar transport system substrate-binding protein
MKDLPGVQVVTDQDAWLQDRAIAVGGDIITANPNIDMIFAANEGGTIGATMAVKNAGREGDIVVFGFDGSEQIVQLLQDPANILQAAIAQDPYNIGVKTMESVINAINNNGNSSTQGQAFIVPGVLLERANPQGLTDFVNDLRSKMGN